MRFSILAFTFISLYFSYLRSKTLVTSLFFEDEPILNTSKKIRISLRYRYIIFDSIILLLFPWPYASNLINNDKSFHGIDEILSSLSFLKLIFILRFMTHYSKISSELSKTMCNIVGVKQDIYYIVKVAF